MNIAVERRSGVSYREFVDRYAKPGVPVIFTDAAKDWDSALRWTPETFKSRFGHRSFCIGGRLRLLGDYIDEVLSSTKSNPAPYFRNVEFISNFPELLPEIPYFKYGKPDRAYSRLLPRKMMSDGWYELFIGGAGGEFPVLHTDFHGVYTWITQIYGVKECVFFAPNQTQYLYPKSENRRKSHVNPFTPDLGKFPLFANAEKITCILNPGESLLVPSEWWHCTRMLSHSISVISAHLTAVNWNLFLRDQWNKRRGRASRLPVLAYLFCAGKILDLYESQAGEIE